MSPADAFPVSSTQVVERRHLLDFHSKETQEMTESHTAWHAANDRPEEISPTSFRPLHPRLPRSM